MPHRRRRSASTPSAGLVAGAPGEGFCLVHFRAQPRPSRPPLPNFRPPSCLTIPNRSPSARRKHNARSRAQTSRSLRPTPQASSLAQPKRRRRLGQAVGHPLFPACPHLSPATPLFFCLFLSSLSICIDRIHPFHAFSRYHRWLCAVCFFFPLSLPSSSSSPIRCHFLFSHRPALPATRPGAGDDLLGGGCTIPRSALCFAFFPHTRSPYTPFLHASSATLPLPPKCELEKFAAQCRGSTSRATLVISQRLPHALVRQQIGCLGDKRRTTKEQGKRPASLDWRRALAADAEREREQAPVRKEDASTDTARVGIHAAELQPSRLCRHSSRSMSLKRTRRGSVVHCAPRCVCAEWIDVLQTPEFPPPSPSPRPNGAQHRLTPRGDGGWRGRRPVEIRTRLSTFSDSICFLSFFAGLLPRKATGGSIGTPRATSFHPLQAARSRVRPLVRRKPRATRAVAAATLRCERERSAVAFFRCNRVARCADARERRGTAGRAS